MFKPTAGELLDGVIDALRGSVLAALPPGGPQRQLRAAIHTLSRLQRSWDLLPAYLDADVTDMRTALEAVLAAVGSSEETGLRDARERLRALAADDDPVIRGVHEPSLAAQCSLHEQLQELLLDVDAWLRAPERSDDRACLAQTRVIDQLFARMNGRHLQAWSLEGAEA